MDPPEPGLMPADVLTRLPDPAGSPGDDPHVTAASWATAGAGHLAVCVSRGPADGETVAGVVWFRRAGDTLTRLADPYPFTQQDSYERGIAFTPDGSHLAVLHNERLRLLRRDGDTLTEVDVARDVDTGAEVESFDNSLSWHDDGTHLAAVAQVGGGGIDMVRVFRRDGDTLSEIPGPYVGADANRVAYGGDLLATTEYNAVRIFRRTGQSYAQVASHPFSGNAGMGPVQVAIRAGEQLAVVTRHHGSGTGSHTTLGGVNLANRIATGFQPHFADCVAVAFDPAGQYLAAGPKSWYYTDPDAELNRPDGLTWARVGPDGALAPLPRPPIADDSAGQVLAWGADGPAAYLLSGGSGYIGAEHPARSYGFAWYRAGDAAPGSLHIHAGDDGQRRVGSAQQPVSMLIDGQGWRTWPGSAEELLRRTDDGGWVREL